jgi:peptide deformylase
MILPIFQVPSPVLTQVATPVVPTDKTVLRLAGDMLDTMRHWKGVGLAAPQVGQSIRLITVSSRAFKWGVLMNPVIVEAKGAAVASYEGCLSVEQGKRSFKVMRHPAIVVQFVARDGSLVTADAEGLGAHVLQHEIDHLDGKLILPG